MASSILVALANHLWQSTLFAVIAGCSTLFFSKNGARVRYLMWLAASVKFLVPFALLTAIGAQIPWTLGSVHRIELFSLAAQMSAPIVVGDDRVMADVAHGGSYSVALPIALGGIWALGVLFIATRWFARWLLIRRALQGSTETRLAFVVPVRSSSLQFEPAVVGIVRPVLLIPRGIEQRLTPEEMRAVLAHEHCHVAWGDNRAGAIQMLVEALFWFHPLVWWIGSRLVDERERACDEWVLAGGHPPENYAEGILKVCEYYLQSRMECVAGIGGASLKQRIEAIVQNRLVKRLSRVQKVLMASAAGATIAMPIGVGVLTSPQAYAQALPLQTDWKSRAAVNMSSAVTARPGDTHEFGPLTVWASAGKLDARSETSEFTNIVIREKDITVQADHAKGGMRVRGKSWEFVGDVRVHFEQRGSLRSDHAFVRFRNGHIAGVVLDGSPAEFELTRAGSSQPTRGHALEIAYDVEDGTVRLTKEAWLSDGRNQLSSELLVYNSRQQRVRTGPEGENGRAKLTISPGGE